MLNFAGIGVPLPAVFLPQRRRVPRLQPRPGARLQGRGQLARVEPLQPGHHARGRHQVNVTVRVFEMTTISMVYTCYCFMKWLQKGLINGTNIIRMETKIPFKEDGF